MLFLFPTRWEFKKNCGTNAIDNKKNQVIYDEIFTNNLNRMKDVARGYYTQDKLPKNVNETKKMTLKEMYDKRDLYNRLRSAQLYPNMYDKSSFKKRFIRFFFFPRL